MSMFGGKRARTRGGAGQVDTLIGSGVSLCGDIRFRGCLYIEGRVQGAIVGEGEDAVLTISANGLVEGDVRAPTVIVSGRLCGDVHAASRVQMNAPARVEGNVHYRVVEMAAGATVSGRLVHTEALAALAAPETRRDEEAPALTAAQAAG